MKIAQSWRPLTIALGICALVAGGVGVARAQGFMPWQAMGPAALAAPGLPLPPRAVVGLTADVLGVTPESLVQALREGKTLARVAAEHGMAPDDLADRLVARAEQVRLQRLRDGIRAFLDRRPGEREPSGIPDRPGPEFRPRPPDPGPDFQAPPGPDFRFEPPGPGPDFPAPPGPDFRFQPPGPGPEFRVQPGPGQMPRRPGFPAQELQRLPLPPPAIVGLSAEILGIEPDVLRQELERGSTLGQIARDQGIEPDALADHLAAAAEQLRLDHMRQAFRHMLDHPFMGPQPR